MSEIRDTELHSLLSEASAKERRALKRATFYVAVPVVIGLLLVAVSAYTVIKLEQKATELKVESETVAKNIKEEEGKLKLTQEQSKAVQDELNKKQEQLEEAKKNIEDAKKAIKGGDSQKALNALNKTPLSIIEKPIIEKPTVSPVGKVT